MVFRTIEPGAWAPAVFPERQPENPPRIATLDGVRGLAILLVLIYHIERALPVAPGQLIGGAMRTGWLGVDLFFALSGFLITGILLDSRDTQLYFVRFYTRRVLRIVPLYVAFVIFALYVTPALGLVTSKEAARFHGLEPWYWTHTVNFLIASSGWESAAAYTKPLWSLGVEEQFYLLWPALVFLLAPRELRHLLLVMLLGAPLLRILLTAAHASSTMIYVLLPTRMDALAVGALLAVFARDPRAWQRCRQLALPVSAVAVALLAAIVYREGGLGWGGRLTQVFGYSPISILAGGTLVHALTATRESLAGLVWSHPALRFFGRYSYGMYVWHTFVIWWIRDSLWPHARIPALLNSSIAVGGLFVAVVLVMTVAVALVSWYVVESPFLRLKRFVPDHHRQGHRPAWTRLWRGLVLPHHRLERP